MTTTNLAAWLIDRIADDEAVARAATGSDWHAEKYDERSKWYDIGADPWEDGDTCVLCTSRYEDDTRAHGPVKADATHIARWDPVRVLAECAAKRRIVKAYEFETDTPPDGTDQPPAMALRLLAAVYAGRDGYDPAWAVE